MSASSSSTISSTVESSAHEHSTVVSVTPSGTPVISIGYISEDTDLDALGVELEQYTKLASLSSSSAIDSSPPRTRQHFSPIPRSLPHAQDLLEQTSPEKPTLQQYLRNLEQTDAWLRQTLPPGPLQAAGLHPSDTNNARDLAVTGSTLQRQVPVDLAILVDTDSGRRKRASKKRPTLAQTLSSMRDPPQHARGDTCVVVNAVQLSASSNCDAAGCLRQISTAQSEDEAGLHLEESEKRIRRPPHNLAGCLMSTGTQIQETGSRRQCQHRSPAPKGVRFLDVS